MNAPQSSSERSFSRPIVAAFSAAPAVRRFRCGSSIASAIATTAGRIATSAVPLSPNTSTAGVISTGAIANPALPPTENKLMPVPRRFPDE